MVQENRPAHGDTDHGGSAHRSLSTVAAKMLRVCLQVALFVAMAGIGTYLALTLLIKGEATVKVPDLVGRDVLSALEMLSDLGLNTRVRGTIYDDRVPKNQIIDQQPDPGTVIKRGRDVRIRVSRGPEFIVMPNLIGLALPQGRILLAENGLCAGRLAEMRQSDSTAGQVIAQAPLPGSRVRRGDCGDLLISQGPPLPGMAMPDLTGKSLAAAITHLTQARLTIGDLRPVHRPGLVPETVIDQSPPAGWRTSPGGRVALSINRIAGHRPAGPDADLLRLFTDNGFYNQRYRVELHYAQRVIGIYDDFVPPGQEIWLLIPKNGNPTVRVFADDQPVAARIQAGR